MFNIGMMELILVLVVAFLVVGPKDLPKVARWIGRQVRTIRKLVREIKQETGWNEFAKEFRDTQDDLKQTVREADVRSELDDIRQSVDSVRTEVQRASDDVKQAADGLKNDINQ